MKRILFLAPSLGVGGMERALVTLANRLVKNGYDVTVMLLDETEDLKDELDKDVRLIRKPYKDHLGKKIPYIRHKFYDDGMWETRAAPKTLYAYYVGDEKYDVEIAFFRGLCVKIVSGSTNFNAVHLAWVHNDFSKAGGYLNNFSGIGQAARAYSVMDNVICVSKDAAQGYVSVIGDTHNISVVYNLLPVERIRSLACGRAEHDITKAPLHLVIVARLLDAAKGQRRLIEAVCALHREGKDVSLTVVGGGEEERQLRQEILEHGASDYIEILGEKKNPYPYIKDADLLVCASYYEGYNLTVAEALILETPVLSTECSGPCEILDCGEYGMIVENSGEGLYRGLKAFCDDPGLLKHYREKAVQRQDFFNEERITRQIEDAFRKE